MSDKYFTFAITDEYLGFGFNSRFFYISKTLTKLKFLILKKKFRYWRKRHGL